MDCKLVCLVVACVAIVCAQRADRQQWVQIHTRCFSQERRLLMTVPVDGDCRTYASCSETLVGIPVIQYCPAGTLFDQNNQVCSFPMSVNCADRNAPDPCSGLSDGYSVDTMRSRDQQAAVLQCLDGRTIGGRLCEVCNAFGNSDTACVPISGCNREPEIIPNDCSLEPVANNPGQYVSIGVNTRTVMNCNNNTVFSQETCGCVN